MNIMELGGELVGGFAVVVTLVYLAIQVRSGARMAESSLHDRTAEAWPAILQPAIDEMDLFIRGAKNYRDLDEGESLKFAMIVANIFVHHENFYLKYTKVGVVGKEELERINRLTTWYLMRPGIGQGFWSDYRLLFTETFAQHVDSLLRAVIRGEIGDIGGGDSGTRAERA